VEVKENLFCGILCPPRLGEDLKWRDEAEHLAGRKVDDGDEAVWLQYAEDAHVNFGRMREMVIKHEDRSTFRWKISVGFRRL
jgi:hypothetical protein